MTAAMWVPASLWQPAETDWQSTGECARLVAEAYPKDRRYIANKWFPIEHQAGKTKLTPEVLEAVAACRRCPVRLECELAGMSERHGLWGGLLPEQREAIRRRVQRQAKKQRQGVGA